MKHTVTILAALLLAPVVHVAAGPSETGQLRAEFANPPFRYHARPLWFWNGKLDAEKTRTMLAACKESGY